MVGTAETIQTGLGEINGDLLEAQQPGVAMLIQETGLQREINLNESARFTPEQEAALFERKVALSFAQGSGAIEWLWNTNSYMTEANEAPIGALRADSTEKPEATLMRDFARFAKSFQNHLQNPKQPSVAIVTSQAAQFSVLGASQLEAQHKAVRALVYDCTSLLTSLPKTCPAKLFPSRSISKNNLRSKPFVSAMALLGR